MADALVSVVLGQLAWLIQEQARREAARLFTAKVAGKTESLRRNLEAIKAVLTDAEKKEVKEDSVRLWLEDLKDVSYDMDNVFDELITAILRSDLAAAAAAASATSSPGLGRFLRRLAHRREIARKIERLNERLGEIRARKDSFNFRSSANGLEEPSYRPESNSMVDVPKVYGQDELKQRLISHVLFESSNHGGGEEGGDDRLQVIPILGMGGIGKTTLAKQVYNDDKVKAHFGDQRMWVCVSHLFDEISIASSIIEQVDGKGSSVMPSMEMLMLFFRRSIEDKKFLLVLDDVWTDDYVKWGPLEQSLKRCAAGSKIIITTRKEEVAQMVGDGHLVRIEKLRDEDSWLLFSEIALFGKNREEREELKQIGMQIASKCKGLPLAAKTLGSLLRVKRTKDEWSSVLQSEIWEIEKVKENLFLPFLIGYYELSPLERCCFSYCAIIPKDALIDRDDLVQQWMAQGYLKLRSNEEEEVVGRKCFESLAMRSFFEDFKYGSDGSITACKMHDMLHDFAQSLTLNEFSTITTDGSQRRLSINARHLVLILPSNAHIPLSSLKKSLRTLVVLGSDIAALSPDQILYLTSLRSLNLSNCSIKDVPENIGKLTHLRYLNLSHNRELKELPSTIGALFNLQTLRLVNSGIQKLPEKVAKLVSLRHLYISSLNLRSLPKGICKLSNLKTLNLSKCGLREIPKNIGELAELKCLDLSDNIELRNLPCTVGDLCNLQTLNVYYSGLDNLPEEVAKLANLRHLYVFSVSLQALPKGIGTLTHLRTFKDLFISDNTERFQLQDLRNLDYLHDISLNGLGIEEHVEKAIAAQLSHKSYLHDLTLTFMEDGDGEIQKNVLEALQPHPNLKNLVIFNYFGSVISPSWIISLVNLKKLVLDYCPNCESFPSLGKLPSLESLEILLLESLNKLGPEFLGRKDSSDRGEGTSSDISLTSPIAVFPKLKRLVLKQTKSFSEWIGIPGWKVDSPARIMPCLEYLMLSSCWSLEALPDFLLTTPLKHLIIEDSPILEEHYRKEIGKDWHKIRHIPCIQFTNDISV